jgi:Protein of unknown function (DUF732)
MSSYDIHHCRRQTPPLLPLGVDSVRCRAGDTKRNGNPVVRIGIASVAGALVSAAAVLTAGIICAGAAGADPGQQQDQFLAILQQEQIPAIDNVPGLVARAHELCGRLNGGESVETVINDEMNDGYGDNPALRLYPARVRRTATRFVIASVDVYCPSHQGELPPP